MSYAPYLNHLSGSQDLVTSYEEVRAGFVALALERNRRATPFVAQARALKAAATPASTPWDLLKIPEIQPGLVTAAGVSDKAMKHLLPMDRKAAIEGLIQTYLEPAGTAFVEELVFRFPLTRGDALGGSMRNVGGALAQRKLTRAIISTLTLAQVPYRWLHSANKQWMPMVGDDSDIELRLRGISWSRQGKNRTVIYNLPVPLVRNNIDLCLLDCIWQEVLTTGFSSPNRYVVLGELKGGIDPAGADEHWKTARTALGRIRDAFSRENLQPQTFFVGAAIERKMAEEIWNYLENGTLDNAANLTDAGQVASLCHWLSTV